MHDERFESIRDALHVAKDLIEQWPDHVRIPALYHDRDATIWLIDEAEGYVDELEEKYYANSGLFATPSGRPLTP